MSELISKSQQEINKCVEAQNKYIRDNNEPQFVSVVGKCWACNRNVYQNYKIGSKESKGITLELASNELVTGCPHCFRSFCE